MPEPRSVQGAGRLDLASRSGAPLSRRSTTDRRNGPVAPPDLLPSRLDLAGVGLLVAAILWTYWAASSARGGADPVAAVLLGTGAALVVGRIFASWGGPLAPIGVVLIAAVLLVRSPGDVFSHEPLSGPFGYANATGSFFVQAAVAGLMVAMWRWPVPVRVLGAGTAVVFAVVPVAGRSFAAAILLIAAPVAILASRGRRGVRRAVAVCGSLFGLVLLTTVILGAGYSANERSGTIDRIVDATLTERRPALWHDAIVIMLDHPARGVGPDRFEEVSPIARRDRDARWAHNGFLQQGAETGFVGLVLLALIFVWGFVRLWVSPAPNAITALGAVALAALGIHASIDYVLHFPAVPIAAAALVGTGMGASRRSR